MLDDFSVTNLLYDVPWANWKLVAYLHTDIKVEVNFLLWGRENWPVRKLEAASNPFVPHSSLEAMTQRMRHWALQNTPADLFDAPRAKCKSQSTLITGGVTTCRAGGSRGVRIFSCYSRMMLRTTTLIHTTVPGHSFIPSSSYRRHSF